MKPNELQCFDPETNKMVDNPVFTTVESLLQHEADNITLKNEAEFTKSEVRRIFGQMKKMLSEIKQLSEKKTKVDKELKERMILRFGREVNMQEMIEFAIKGLIHSQKDKASFKNKEMKTEMKVLSNKLYDKTSELLEATRENTNKMHIKCALLEERNKTMEYLLKVIMPLQYRDELLLH
ncbi:hypothetical protein O3M35_007858 [Rhynocoris fuscipes]|uniref:Uncharacterized protein n=1 Tax=Rhynocoris fuscipes TaxID=488301 RepID=A0AAW1DG27_9HEMI